MDLNYARDTTSGREGLDLLTQLQANEGAPPIVVMTGWATVGLAVEAMQRGVGDFVEKPWVNTRLLEILKKQIELGRERRDGRNSRELERTARKTKSRLQVAPAANKKWKRRAQSSRDFCHRKFRRFRAIRSRARGSRRESSAAIITTFFRLTTTRRAVYRGCRGQRNAGGDADVEFAGQRSRASLRLHCRPMRFAKD